MEYTIYFILLSWCIFIGLISRLIVKKEKNIVEFMFIYAPLFIISAFRTEEVGADTRRYVEILYECSQINIWEILDSGYEPGYSLFNSLISILSTDGQILLISSSFFIVFGIGSFFYRYSEDYLFATILFVGLGIYSYLFTPIRQSMAIPLLLWGMSYLWNGKRLASFICVAMATMFHYSSAIFFLYILGYPYKKKKMILLIIISTMICGIVYLVGRNYMDMLLIGKYGTYNTVEGIGSVAIGAGIVRILLFAGLSCMGWYNLLKFRNNMTYQCAQKCYILSFICYCGAMAVFLGYHISFLARYDVSFWAFVCLLASWVYDRFSIFMRTATYPIIIFALTIYMYANYYIRRPLEQIYHDILTIL